MSSPKKGTLAHLTLQFDGTAHNVSILFTDEQPQPCTLAHRFIGDLKKRFKDLRLAGGVDPREVVGIGVDGVGWTLLPVDEAINPLAPAMIWLDSDPLCSSVAMPLPIWAGSLPSTVIPTGLNGAGLPIGIQIIGPEYGDLITIGAARALEAEGFAFTPPPAYL